nr:MAG TPA: hypothetical protein [Caudoviricetes sp.]
MAALAGSRVHGTSGIGTHKNPKMTICVCAHIRAR